jgi:hypothetical protein
MIFPGVSQPESNDYFPPLAKIRIAFENSDHVFFDLFSIIALWYARTTRHVILHNLRKKSAGDLNFWWSYCNFCPRPVTMYFPFYLSLRRVVRILIRFYFRSFESVFSSTEIGLIPVTTCYNFHYPTTCSVGCPPKRGHILIFFTPENGTNRQILLKRKFPALVPHWKVRYFLI